jgi:hypothetical protein
VEKLRKALCLLLIFILLLGTVGTVYGEEPVKDSLVETLLKQNVGKLNKDIVNRPDKYEVQVLFTEILRAEDGTITFVPHEFRVDAKKYYFPASSVKLSATALSLEKLNRLKVSGLTKSSTMKTGVGHSGQTARTGTIAQYIRNILLYSDNDSFSRLYEFIGQKEYNEALWAKGYSSARILHRLSGSCSYEENKYTNPITFYNDTKKLYQQPQAYSKLSLNNKGMAGLSKGTGYMSGGQLVKKPLSFLNKNNLSIADQQSILKAILFPETVEQKQRFNLTKADYAYLKKYMLGTGSATYKYFFCGGIGTVPKGIEIYNKIGMAYGTLTDNAYIRDGEGHEFLLTATIYVNKDGILNDDQYDYNTVGLPFFKSLGKICMDYVKTSEAARKAEKEKQEQERLEKEKQEQEPAKEEQTSENTEQGAVPEEGTTQETTNVELN